MPQPSDNPEEDLHREISQLKDIDEAIAARDRMLNLAKDGTQ